MGIRQEVDAYRALVRDTWNKQIPGEKDKLAVKVAAKCVKAVGVVLGAPVSYVLFRVSGASTQDIIGGKF